MVVGKGNRAPKAGAPDWSTGLTSYYGGLRKGGQEGYPIRAIHAESSTKGVESEHPKSAV